MQQDGSASSMKRFLDQMANLGAEQEKADSRPSIFGGVGTISGNIVFVGEMSASSLKEILTKRKASPAVE